MSRLDRLVARVGGFGRLRCETRPPRAGRGQHPRVLHSVEPRWGHAGGQRLPMPAEAAYRKALDLDPNTNVHRILGLILLAQGRPDAMLAEMERVSSPMFRRLGLALAYHAMGRKADAKAALAELIERDAGNAAFQIAEVYAFRGDGADLRMARARLQPARRGPHPPQARPAAQKHRGRPAVQGLPREDATASLTGRPASPSTPRRQRVATAAARTRAPDGPLPGGFRTASCTCG